MNFVHNLRSLICFQDTASAGRRRGSIDNASSIDSLYQRDRFAGAVNVTFGHAG